MLETRRLHHSGHRADVSSRLRRRVAARRSKSASWEKRFISTAHSTRGLTRQLRGLRAFTGDGHDAPVEVRCGAPVEAHLSVAHGATPFNRREIEIIAPDASIKFVRALAREEDDGAVCVSIPSTVAGPVRGRRGKERQKPLTVLGDEQGAARYSNDRTSVPMLKLSEPQLRYPSIPDTAITPASMFHDSKCEVFPCW